MSVLAIAAAGALGAVARAVVDHVAARRSRGVLPLGTFLVNTLGSLLAGALAGAAVGDGLAPGVGTVAGVGFAGSFTTFSTFACDTALLLRQGRRLAAAANIAVNLGGSLAAVGLGLAVVTALS